MKKTEGYILIEVLISLSILSILSLPILSNLYKIAMIREETYINMKENKNIVSILEEIK